MSQRSEKRTKYIFVTGGVVSSLGKGLAAASVGRLLEDHRYTVALQKFDPYINVDPGTMSPYQHGEVYVTDDGAETDLDLPIAAASCWRSRRFRKRRLNPRRHSNSCGPSSTAFAFVPRKPTTTPSASIRRRT